MKIIQSFVFLSLICFACFCVGRNAIKEQLYKRKLKERRSNYNDMNKKNHKLSCVRNMKYWNGISCEDFTEKTCLFINYYWDKTQNKCFFNEELACKYKNMYWSSEGCVDFTRETCLEQHMIWNSQTKTCDYEQQEIQYIDMQGI